jgi:hypothetical protein
MLPGIDGGPFRGEIYFQNWISSPVLLVVYHPLSWPSRAFSAPFGASGNPVSAKSLLKNANGLSCFRLTGRTDLRSNLLGHSCARRDSALVWFKLV